MNSLLLLILISTVSTSCQKNPALHKQFTKVPVIEFKNKALHTGIRMCDWLILGSFHLDVGKSISLDTSGNDLNHDFLNELATPETAITEQNFLHVVNIAQSQDKPLKLQHISTDLHGSFYHTDAEYVDLTGAFKNTVSGIAYGACFVESRVNQTVALFASANDGMKCWVNNTLVLTIDPTIGTGKKKGIKFYDRLKLIHLKAGRNLVLVKVSQKSKDWGFVAKLTSLPRAHIMAAEYSLSPLLENRVLISGAPLKISYSLCDSLCPVMLNIEDVHGISVLSERFLMNGQRSASLGALSQGLYYARLTTPYGSCTETFCLGDLDAEIVRIRQRIAAQDPNPIVRMHTDAWLYRIKHLYKPEYKKITEWNWQDKILNAMSNLEAVLADPQSGQNVLKSPGYRIRAFRSAIDGQVQYYNLIVPSHITMGKKLPLMIMVPGSFIPARPFLESELVADVKDINKYRAMAEVRGFIVAMPGARGNAAGCDMRENDLMDVIADIERYYMIDRDRIYGVGASDGGRQLLLFAAHHPALFAALATFGPLLDPSGIESGAFNPPDPAELVDNLNHIPLFIMHSIGDMSQPVLNSIEFARLCKSKGLDVTLQLTKGGTHNVQTEDLEEAWWAFVAGKKRVALPHEITVSARQLRYGQAYWIKITGIGDMTRLATLRAIVDAPTHISVHTENVLSYELLYDRMPKDLKTNIMISTDGHIIPQNALHQKICVQVQPPGTSPQNLIRFADIEGPVANVFANSFIIIEGTAGDQNDRDNSSSIGRSIRDAWREDYYVDCRYMTDTATAAKELTKHNLILIGNTDNNAVLRRIKKSLPIQFFSNHIDLAGQVYQGNNIVVEAIFPNPLSPDRLMVVIGSNSQGKWKIPDSRLWAIETFDYAVFTRGSKFVSMGKFNGARQLFIAKQ